MDGHGKVLELHIMALLGSLTLLNNKLWEKSDNITKIIIQYLNL